MFKSSTSLALLLFSLAGTSAFAQEGPVFGTLDETAPLYDSVPERLKAQGHIKAAMVSDSPPNQYVEPGTKNLVGINPDLLVELSAAIGLPFEIEVTNFQAQLPGLAAKRYDMIAGPFGDTAERQESVDFVDYSATASVAVAATTSDIYVETLDGLCGYSMAASQGDVNSRIIEAQSAKCVEDGAEPIALTSYKDIAATWQGVISGREQLLLSTNSIAPYYAMQSNGAIKIASDPLGPESLAGYMFPKDDPELRDLILAGFETIIDSGAYGDVLSKWDVEAIALDEPLINAGPGWGQ